MYLLYSKKKAYILIGIVILVLCGLFIVSSYAFDQNKEIYSEKTDNLVITYDGLSNQIEAPIEVLENEQEALKYDFLIKNTLNHDLYYYIQINFLSEIDPEILKFIKIKIDDEVYYYTETGYIQKIKSKVAKNQQISIWISNVDNNGKLLKDVDKLDVLYEVVIKEKSTTLRLSDTISSSTTGVYKDDYGNYRYYGINPNNYITFNDETWRIIGLIENDNQKLVKLVRDEYLPKIAFDSGSGMSSNFKESQLNNILNVDGYINSKKVECPNKANSASLCDFQEIGINEISKNMIEPSLYNQGGYYSSGINSLDIYDSEVNNRNNGEVLVSILSASDYGFATGSTYKNVHLSSYNLTVKEYNWLYKGSEEYLINNNTTDYQKVFSINKEGAVEIDNKVDNALFIRPIVFLKENINIDKGDGSIENPYQITLEENA